VPKAKSTPEKPAPKLVSKVKESALVPGWDTEPDDCLISGEDFYKRLRIPLKEGVKVIGRVAVLHMGRGKKPIASFKLISNAQEAVELKESEAFKKAKLLEAYGDAFSVGLDQSDIGNPSDPNAPNAEFVSVMGGPFDKQLYLYDYLKMHGQAFEAKNHNPLAKQIIDTITNFSLGKGVAVMFKDENAQAEWNDFVRRNDFQSFLRVDCDSLTWGGELMTQKVERGGLCWVKHRDPSTCWEVVTNPRDITEVLYYHFQWPTQYQLVYHAGDEVSEYVIEDLDPSELIHVKINVAPGEKRGRSDLFPVLGWLKRFKDYYNAKVIKAQVEESFAIVKTVKGSPEDVNALMSDPTITATPPPGSVIIENEGITTSFLTPTTSSQGGRDNTGEQIRSIIATGVGLSPEYLGVSSMSSARATAMQHSEPSARKFERRQQDMEAYIRQVVEWVLEVGKRRGRVQQTRLVPANLALVKKALGSLDFGLLAKAAMGAFKGELVEMPADMSYEVIFPEISTDDRSQKLKDIATAAVFKAISHKRASTMMAKELMVTAYDYVDEQEAIREEQENRMIQAGMVGGLSAAQTPKFGGGEPKPGSAEDNADFKDKQGEE